MKHIKDKMQIGDVADEGEKEALNEPNEKRLQILGFKANIKSSGIEVTIGSRKH